MPRYQHQLHAMGSDVIFTIVSNHTPESIEHTFESLVQIVEAFEQRFSRFLPRSELTHFNQRAGEKVSITKEFRRLLDVAKTFSDSTGGVYNPFILPALQHAGYIGSWPTSNVAASAPVYSERQVVPMGKLEIGDDWAKIPASTALDFGGIGKGYLLDILANKLDDEKLTKYWLSLGGDIQCRGFDNDDRPWKIGVANAKNESNIIDYFSNTGGNRLAIATSGVTKRKGTHNGKAWHHLIDPSTGTPADTNILTATVTTQLAVAADVYAKCLVILGLNNSLKFIKSHKLQEYLLQVVDNNDTLSIVKPETLQL